MWTLFFFVTTLLCAEKWFVARVAEMALIQYIQDKKFPRSAAPSLTHSNQTERRCPNETAPFVL